MIRPIETSYRGYRFRSRLEARWAVWFDALKTSWLYEPEGFNLGPAGLYLPDFWLSDLDCWIEVKPEPPAADQARRCMALAAQSSKAAVMLVGTPGDEWLLIFRPDDMWIPRPGDLDPHFALDGRGRLCICSGSDRPGGAGKAWTAFKPRDECRHDGRAQAILLAAACAARAARFEYGEQPQASPKSPAPRVVRAKPATKPAVKSAAARAGAKVAAAKRRSKRK